MIKLNRLAGYGLVGVTAGFVMILFQALPLGQRIVASVRLPVISFLGEFENLNLLQAPRMWFESKYQLQNALLQCELKLRQTDAAAAQNISLIAENEELKKSLSAVSNTRQWIGAKLLDGEGKFFIDRGENGGVKDGAIVIGDGAFVGVVTSVSPGLSQLSTLWDEDMRFGVSIQKKNLDGVITYEAGRVMLTTVSRVSGVEIGDKVVTRGDPSVQKEGILIGEIESDLTRPADPVNSFVVKLAIGKELKTVLVEAK